MSVTFSNVTYAPAFWGVVYLFHHLGTVDYVCDDSITLNGTVAAVGDSVTVSYRGGAYSFIATTHDASGAIVLQHGEDLYAFANAPLTQGQVLALSTDGPGDYQVPCFAEGTRILTRRGEIAVEALAAGDEALALLRGELAPIVWIGRRHVELGALDDPARLWPVRIAAQAFGPGQPYRDLLLSPDHAILTDGVLIPVHRLENGTTIRREPYDRITYFHVELDRHDAVLAEGLAAESYLDTGNRADFAGLRRDPARAVDAERRARAIWAARGAAPLRESGPVVQAVRARLARRAAAMGQSLDEAPTLRLRQDRQDHAARRDGRRWHAALPERAPGSRLMSRCLVPANVLPGHADGRCLGVPVTRLVADGHPLPLDHPALGRGWHAPEDGLRWTNGAAELPPLRTLCVELAPITACGAAPPHAAAA